MGIIFALKIETAKPIKDHLQIDKEIKVLMIPSIFINQFIYRIYYCPCCCC
uniref:Bm13097, isoform a n=1 Tax=Brugia malayi TaxID=6279 RepID=A0A1I9G262_BRUMA|nr:Bm13097, isoform a [Brugia malayi]